MRSFRHIVAPAKAGAQGSGTGANALDSRVRGNDGAAYGGFGTAT